MSIEYTAENNTDAPEIPARPGIDQERPAGPGSLAARIQKRRDELAQRETTIIEVNGYESFLAVEYAALPWQQMSKIVTRNQRTRDEGLQQLYIASDTLIRACEGVYEVAEDGSRTPLNMGWGVALARYCGWEVPIEGVTDRQAMLSYMFAGHDSWLMAHFGEYSLWLQGQREDEDEEVGQDFGKTQ